MSTPRRLAGFGVALVAILGVGAGVGATVGPDVETTEEEAPAPIGQGVVAAAAGEGASCVRLLHDHLAPNLRPQVDAATDRGSRVPI